MSASYLLPGRWTKHRPFGSPHNPAGRRTGFPPIRSSVPANGENTSSSILREGRVKAVVSGQWSVVSGQWSVASGEKETKKDPTRKHDVWATRPLLADAKDWLPARESKFENQESLAWRRKKRPHPSPEASGLRRAGNPVGGGGEPGKTERKGTRRSECTTMARPAGKQARLGAENRIGMNGKGPIFRRIS